MIRIVVSRLKHFIINCVSFLLVVFVLSCSTIVYEQQEKKSDLNQLIPVVETVWQYAQLHPFGFTLDFKKMKSISKGFAVSYIETQNSFGKEGLTNTIEWSIKQDGLIGGWLNDKDGRYYFDSVKLFKDSAYSEAMDFAKKNKQMAIYVNNN